ncbi:MAG TPA: DUF2007 domain-containing protein [Candidatus Sabulitectum sp.]|nr:DUF2007 domain-containing protein [Candidatus Sabulitectum sp.]HPF33554.1 DUF2007 domain-containing protein [Candidatus Sabulitectum sp.]HPJ28697.1 DUF2007 domain-containing protein [Candidatus Sabulitectum sp.]HPR22851.1 DUF2007 domain-containing protein [Candidatus Sabulitectum sp.]
MSELLEVMAFDTRVEAEIAQGLLEEQGIESLIRAADCGGMLMGVSLVRRGGIKLMVSGEDFEKASEALEVLSGEAD